MDNLNKFENKFENKLENKLENKFENKFEMDEIKNMTKGELLELWELWNKDKNQISPNTIEHKKENYNKGVDIRISMPWTMQNI